MTALSPRLVPIELRQGIDTKTSRFAGIVGRLTELENGVFTKVGELRKRYGQDRIVAHVENGAAITQADGIATFRNELLVFGEHGRVFSLSGALDKWLDRGAIVSVDVDERPIVRNSAQQSVPDVATGGTMTCIAWEDTRNGVRCSIIDNETGVPLVADVEVSASGTRPRVVAFDSAFYVIYSAGVGIFWRKITWANPTVLGTEQNPIATNDSALAAWDVSVIGSRLYAIWCDTTTATARYGYLDTDDLWTVQDSLTAADQVTLWGDPDFNVWLLTSGAGGQTLKIVNSAHAEALAATTVGSLVSPLRIAGVTVAGKALMLFEMTGSLVYTASCTYGGGASGTSILLRSVGLAGRPFNYGGENVYVPVVHDSTQQATLFFVDAVTGRVVAKAQTSISGGARARNTVSSVVATATGTYTTAATVVTALESDVGGVTSRDGVALVDLDFTGQARYLTAELAGNLLVAGGVLHAYDGVNLVEHGFHLFPEGLTSSTSAGAGSIDAGSHSWRAVYEWTDAQGRIHRSSPSEVETVVSVANDRTTITIPTLRLTAKSNVRVAVYRTVAAGSVYYRLGTIAGTTLNDTTTDSVSYIDSATDASIIGNEILYTDGASGSELPNIAPPSSSAICSHRGRIFLVTGRDRISFSKQVADGYPVEFNDALYLLPDARGGALVAVASMDDKLVIFREHAIYFTTGDGPSDTGAGGFPEPVLITSDAGCSEVRSVVLTNAGLMFKSSKGIYLLDRSLAVTYIGAAVEDWNGLTITSANMVPNTNEVRFTTSGTVTVDNVAQYAPTLVYDYAFGQWATFTNYAAADATVWGTTFVRVQSNGKVYKEDRTAYDDDGSHVRLRLTTTWMSLGGVQGFKRLYRVLILGDYKSAHTLRCRIGYDFSPGWEFDEDINAETAVGAGTWGSSDTWGSDAVWGGAAPVDWFQARPGKQKCSSVRLCIEDVQTETATEGLTIANIALLAGVKRGTQKLSATKAF